MIPEVFIDTDVIIDFLVSREPFCEQASELFDLHEKGEGLSINTTGIVAHLVKAIQELEKRVKELEG